MLANETTAAAALESLGISGSFPVGACFFDDRVLSFSDSYGCPTLAKLAVTPIARQVLDGSKDIPNFGAVSAREVTDFQHALATADRVRLRANVPLAQERDGIDLGQAGRRAAEACGLGLEGLRRRLVFQRTLEEVGRWKDVTRERVRQVEEDFTSYLNRVLDGIPGERARRWNEWERTGSIGPVPSDESSEVCGLVQAALRHSFSRQPEAEEIRIRQFQLARQAAESLALVPAVYKEGANAQEIIGARHPALRWHRFVAWNAEHARFVVRDDGRFQLTAPKARNVVAALLAAGERRPRAIIDFLVEVPELWSWPHDSLASNCANWAATDDFPRQALVVEEPDLAIRHRLDPKLDAVELAKFVRQTGPRRLVSVSGTEFTVEGHQDGVVIVNGKDKGRRFDLKSLREYVDTYNRTKSKKTTGYGGGFHSTYFISLVDAYEHERPYAAEEIDAADIEKILEAKPTEQMAMFLSRIGQGKFRADLIANRKICYLTGLADPRFLRASHIKPWRDCDDSDRLDWRNGLLLTPNLDLLFDRGLISFADDGTLLVSSLLSDEIRARFGLQTGLKGAPLCDLSRGFMAEHRAKCFRP